jgi:DNA-binding response OmpR family regulator
MSRPDAQKILAVDDEQDIIELLSYNLSREGFEVATAVDGEEALKKIRARSFDLVILDLMMPGIQGMELCRILRNTKTRFPIICLREDRRGGQGPGLEMGADDYITKAFQSEGIDRRIKAVLRRSASALPEEYITAGELSINTETWLHKTMSLNLSPTEFRLLLYLVERKGKIFNREHLLNAVWKDEGYVEPRTVDVHISRIRTQIEDDPANPVYIKTRRGHGYYFEDTLPKTNNLSGK